MIVCHCNTCGKDLKVKDEFAGKRIKCPGCGQPITVPAVEGATVASQTPLKGAGDARTLAPKPRGDERTMPPDRNAQDSVSAGASQTAPAAGKKASEPNPDLWDFLAPAEKPDEIGRLGTYRVLKVLGAGGMGVVFRAEDPGLERLVALKAMLPALAASPSAKQRFFREARAAAALKHPNIVTIFQVGEDRGAPFLAMEFLEGEPLDERLKRERKLPVPDILYIGRQIAEGLAAAHDKGLIHRDIKPANVWLESVVSSPSSVAKDNRATTKDYGPRTTDYHVKILDFGLARTMADQTQLTQSGAIIGTPAYMAPEQAAGRTVDHRCDLFSLGCVLYKMATGQAPFKGSDTLAILSALAMETPEPPVVLNLKLPTELSDLIMDLLEKKPQDRPQSAREVADALAALESGGTTAVASRARKDRGRNREQKTQTIERRSSTAAGQKRWVFIGGGVAAAILLAIVGFVLFKPASSSYLQITNDVPGVQLAVGAGAFETLATGKNNLKVEPGTHRLRVRREEKQEFETEQFQVAAGETRDLKIEINKGILQVVLGDRAIGGKIVKMDGEPGNKDRDRLAAEGVLGLGGNVTVVAGPTPELLVNDKGQLPAGDFQVTKLSLYSRKNVKDDDLAVLKGLSRLADLNLLGTSVTDDGLAHLRNLPALEVLELSATKVVGRGLVHLAELKGLKSLNMADLAIANNDLQGLASCQSLSSLGIFRCRLNDQGLKNIEGLTNLTSLSIMDTDVSDDGLSSLQKLVKLRSLNLYNLKITDKGLAQLRDLKSLETLHINNTLITSEGVQHLAGLKRLVTLILANTKIDGEALKQLTSLAALGRLDVTGTQVSPQSIVTLRAALPKCDIAWDDPSAANADRQVAEWLASIGGGIYLVGKPGIDVAKNLPADPFHIGEIVLWSNQKVKDGDLTRLKGLTKITALLLGATQVGDAGMVHIKDLRSLENLNLASTHVTDVGAVHLKGLTNLQILGLGGTKIGDESLAYLKDMPRLSNLELSSTRVSGSGLAKLDGLASLERLFLNHLKISNADLVHLKKLKNLELLELTHTPLSDEGLESLKGLTALKNLNLKFTKVTDKAVAELQKALPGCKIQPASLAADAERLAAEWVFKVGGTLSLVGRPSVKSFADLPDGDIAIREIDLRYKKFPAKELERLKGLQDVRVLFLMGTSVGDEHMVFLKDLRSLDRLFLSETLVGDAGLKHLEGLSDLKTLTLDRTTVSDVGLGSVGKLTILEALSLRDTRVADGGLEKLKELQWLQSLVLNSPKVGDRGLEHIKGLANLRELRIEGTKVTSAGMKHLKGLTKLSSLGLNSTQVGDPGLAELKALSSLQVLFMTQTKATAKGVADLQKALPKCKIWSDFSK